ncbi:MAG TPA: CSLREA domain-containing protein, partial [Actinomycetota bacterium]
MWRRSLAVALLLVGAGLPFVSPAHGAGDVLVVDTFEDSYDGTCADGDCSLRDAVASAPAHGARIVLPSGYYALTTPEAGAGAGDGSVEFAQVGGALTIVGEGESGTFVDGGALGSSMFV